MPLADSTGSESESVGAIRVSNYLRGRRRCPSEVVGYAPPHPIDATMISGSYEPETPAGKDYSLKAPISAGICREFPRKCSGE